MAQQAERDTRPKPDVAPEVAGKPKKKSPENDKNATVIAIFNWILEKERVLNIPKYSLAEDYILFPKPEEEKDTENAGWGDEAGSTDWGAQDTENQAQAPDPSMPMNKTSSEGQTELPKTNENDDYDRGDGEDIILGVR